MSAYPPKSNPSAPALPISATVICKNEEACIGKCLSSLEGLSEIVVVDFGLDRRHPRDRRGLCPPRSSDPAHPSAVARLRRPEAVRPRSGDANPGCSASTPTSGSTTICSAELPRLIAADEAIAGWKLRRTLTLYGRLEAGEPVDAARTHPASRPARPRALRRLAPRSRGPNRRRRDARSPARAFCAMSAACRSTSR